MKFHMYTHPLDAQLRALYGALEVPPRQKHVLRHLHAPADQRDLQDLRLGQVLERSGDEAGKDEDVDEACVVRDEYNCFARFGQVL